MKNLLDNLDNIKPYKPFVYCYADKSETEKAVFIDLIFIIAKSDDYKIDIEVSSTYERIVNINVTSKETSNEYKVIYEDRLKLSHLNKNVKIIVQLNKAGIGAEEGKAVVRYRDL